MIVIHEYVNICLLGYLQRKHGYLSLFSMETPRGYMIPSPTGKISAIFQWLSPRESQIPGTYFPMFLFLTSNNPATSKNLAVLTSIAVPS